MDIKPIRRTDRAEEKALRKPLAGDIPLSQVINPLVKRGELYERLPNDSVHCFACAHNCKINPGGRGICQVRYNLDGELFVPYGYVAALAADPTEKKPFFHVYPGSDTLTFGMLGCDLHCSYCFTSETIVITERGPMTFAAVFKSATRVEQMPDGEVAYPNGLCAITATGTSRPVCAVFKHPYHGRMAVIQPYYLPELRCTPDHRVYATDDITRAPEPMRAANLTMKHYLAVPRHYSFSTPQVVDVVKELSLRQTTYRIPWELSAKDRAGIMEATRQGVSSRELGAHFGKSASYIRHVRSKMARGRANDVRTSGPLVDDGTLRFPNEHRPGIPLAIPLDEDMARLLGYYCAEGSVVRSKSRPNSHVLNFSFSHTETALVEQVRQLLQKCLGVESQCVSRETTCAVTVGKASAALLFDSLAGSRANEKRVPQILFNAPRPVVEAFLDAYISGDGHRYQNGKMSSTTVSSALAYGLAWLALKLGFLPSIYDTPMPEEGSVLGRKVKRSPHQYSMVWYETSDVTRRVVETDNYYLVPIRNLSFVEFDGDVFNMEVEAEHNYLANFLLVKNCQNWDISQAMRDSEAGRPPTQITPEQMVALAKRNRTRCVASSYNEPLITSEWARAIFQQAQAAGLTCLFVSNGNATREVLEYIRPYTDGYKIDLKSMRDKNYRQLGAPLEHILEGARMVHALGFWLEFVTLIVPGWNDSEDELRDAARFIKSLSPDIPWHVTAYHQDYKMLDHDATGARQLVRAAEMGYAEGLHYVYAGNLPGRVGEFENTYCPSCRALLIERVGYVILDYMLTAKGECPKCHTRIPGLWPTSRDEVRTGTIEDLYFRVPRGVS
ncbi:MAG TPA: radical SAM protein [Anaerolineae bacterium]